MKYKYGRDKKDRLEKLITNLLDGEGYSKLQQFVKENVKAVLSDNKIVISISFAALIQTLKADPQMVKLIHNIPSANDGEQNKENNDNVTKYLESHKDRLVDVAEKHYKNIVETLTNNAIDNAAAAALSIPTLSSLQSISTFPNLFNQSNICRKQQSEIYHNRKGNNGAI